MSEEFLDLRKIKSFWLRLFARHPFQSRVAAMAEKKNYATSY
jgi:hypothetical protein